MDSEGCVSTRHARDVKCRSRVLFIKLHNCISPAFYDSHNQITGGNVDHVLRLLLFSSTLSKLCMADNQISRKEMSESTSEIVLFHY